MTVFVAINGYLRRASFYEQRQKNIDNNIKNQTDKEAVLKINKRFGILKIGDDITIKSAKYKVLSRETLLNSPWYNVYSLRGTNRSQRVY